MQASVKRDEIQVVNQVTPKTMPTINKILVIGAGIAGPAVCYWLKKFGFSPILIEKFANIRKGGFSTVKKFVDINSHLSYVISI